MIRDDRWTRPKEQMKQSSAAKSRAVLGLLAVCSIIVNILMVAGCAETHSYDVLTAEKVIGPKEIALLGPRYPWVIEIEKRLRAEGFSVKRWASQHQTTELVSPTKIQTYQESPTRILLSLDGYAPNSSMTRCFGGGYKFDYIQAELIDVANNEVIASYSNSGYSENCPPLSGSIFSDIAAMVVAAF